MKTPAALVAEFLLLVVDCLLNWFLMGSFFESMSARAARNRADHQPLFFWCADAVDALFFWQPNHCELQRQREDRYGGAWGAFLAVVRGEKLDAKAEPAP